MKVYNLNLFFVVIVLLVLLFVNNLHVFTIYTG